VSHTDIDLLTTRDLLRLPPPAWLVDHLIPERGVVGLYGHSGDGKSFIALDWAMHISEGMPWLGHAVKQAPVIYIAAEGGSGIQKRVRAWMRAHDKVDLPAMYFLVHPLYVREEGVVEAFLDSLNRELLGPDEDIQPGLVVLDTLSRSFGNGEENSSADMSHFVDKVTGLAAARSMSMLVVHHKNATGSRERGHTAFRASLDAMFSCEAEKNGDGKIIRITLKNDKQKDDMEAPPIYVQPKEGQGLSLVFEEAPPPEKKEKGGGPPVPMRKVDMLRILSLQEDGLTWREWRLASGIDKNRFNRRIKQLTDDGEIFKDDGRYYAYPANVDIAEDDENE
jgi:AAA domain-containing protein